MIEYLCCVSVTMLAVTYMYVPRLTAHNRNLQDSDLDNHKQCQTNLRCTWLDLCECLCTVDYTVILGVPVLSGSILIKVFN